jgi:acetylornithine/succinyldiaminopimelate/putrescine aminotransferase
VTVLVKCWYGFLKRVAAVYFEKIRGTSGVSRMSSDFLYICKIFVETH